MSDAWVPHTPPPRKTHPGGPLSGLTVAVKDVFDWAGVPTGAGNPDWLATHEVPTRDADILSQLLAAGASLAGKTVTDELAYSIQGENVHYSVASPAVPGRITGGSSSGSAAAVAAGLADVGLGTDTGGSIRVPSAYCGLWGLRTTRGAVSTTGVVPLAPSFDTVGWMTCDSQTLLRLTNALLPVVTANWTTVARLHEAEALADDTVRQGVARWGSHSGLTTLWLDDIIAEFGGLEALRSTFATLQGFEAWQSHGEWITRVKPAFGEAVAARFQQAAAVTTDQAEMARERTLAFRSAFREALGGHTVLVLPSAPGPAPLAGARGEAVDALRTRTMRLTAVAGLAGLPQVNIPFWGNDLPHGLGLVGSAGSDGALVALAAKLGGNSW